MNGAVLIFSACLQANCMEAHLPMPEANIITCITQVQPELAKWLDERLKEGWIIKSWRCVEAGEEDDLL